MYRNIISKNNLCGSKKISKSVFLKVSENHRSLSKKIVKQISRDFAVEKDYNKMLQKL
jgi:hypothetical protein